MAAYGENLMATDKYAEALEWSCSPPAMDAFAFRLRRRRR